MHEAYGTVAVRSDLSGDDGLRRAWQAHADEILAYASHVLGDRESAEEALQETFLRAWRAADRYDPERPLRPWLFAIVRNVTVDHLRARDARPVPHDRPEPPETDIANPPRDAIEASLDAWVVATALDRLAEHHRGVLVETFLRGRPYSDVARDLGIPEGTARSRAFHALRAMRVVLEEMGWEP